MFTSSHLGQVHLWNTPVEIFHFKMSLWIYITHYLRGCGSFSCAEKCAGNGASPPRFYFVHEQDTDEERTCWLCAIIIQMYCSEHVVRYTVYCTEKQTARQRIDVLRDSKGAISYQNRLACHNITYQPAHDKWCNRFKHFLSKSKHCESWPSSDFNCKPLYHWSPECLFMHSYILWSCCPRHL